MRVSVWRAASALLGLVAAITPFQTSRGQTTEKAGAAAPAPVVMTVRLDAGAAELALGYVAPGASRTVVASLSNPLDVPITIREVKSECTCMTAAPTTGTIPPKGALPITVTFKATDKPSGYSKRLLIWTDHQKLSKLTLTVTARVGQPLGVSPSPLEFGAVAPGAERRLLVNVANDGETPVKPIYATSSDASVTAQVPRVTIAPHQSAEIPVVVKAGPAAPAAGDPKTATISLHTDCATQSEVSLAVTYEVGTGQPASATPAAPSATPAVETSPATSTPAPSAGGGNPVVPGTPTSSVPAAPVNRTTATATPPAAPGEELIQLTFPENLEVKVLIDYVSTRLGMNILYDESKVRQRVTIISPTKIPRDSLLGFLQSVLKIANLALIEGDQPGWKQIVESKDINEISKGIVKDPLVVAAAEATMVITQQFELKRTTPAEVDKMVKPFLSKPGGNTFAIAERSILFVTDYADVLRRIGPLVTLLDQERPEAKLEFVTVRNWDCEELAKRVTTLLAEKDRVSGSPKDAAGKVTLTTEPRTNQIVLISATGAADEARALIERLDVPSSLETKTYRFKYIAPSRVDKLARDFAETGELKERYKSTVDAESGLLIVRGSQAVHEHIERLRQDLDVAAAEKENEGYVRFYKLVNTTAMEVLTTIRSLETGGRGLSAESVAFLAGESTSGTKKARDEHFAGPNYPPPALGEPLPKPPVYKESEKKDGAKDASAESTKKPEATATAGTTASASVAVTTTATTKDATVTADPNTNTLIVVAPPPVQKVYERLIKLLDKRRPQVMVEMILVTLDTSNNFSLGVELAKAGEVGADGQYLTFSSFELSAADLATGALTLEPGIGANAVLLAPGKVSAVLRALGTSGRSEVVSAPRVLVNDNATATLASVAEASFTSINASDTVSTTSFGGYVSAGTNVSVTPHISEGDHLMVNYSLSLSSFGEGGTASIPPPRQTNDISSEVTIPDGYTVVVGGLTRKDKSESESHIPFLGDIPLLKYLFGTTTRSHSETTLYVFIRPVILRDDRFEDLKYLSEGDCRTAELPPEFPTSQPIVMR